SARNLLFKIVHSASQARGERLPRDLEGFAACLRLNGPENFNAAVEALRVSGVDLGDFEDSVFSGILRPLDQEIELAVPLPHERLESGLNGRGSHAEEVEEGNPVAALAVEDDIRSSWHGDEAATAPGAG